MSETLHSEILMTHFTKQAFTQLVVRVVTITLVMMMLCVCNSHSFAQEDLPQDYSNYGPAVQAVMEAKRTTPSSLVKGALLLIDLGEPALAEQMFQQLLKSDPEDAAKAKLVRKLGSHTLMRLARMKKTLGPEAATFADACMAALKAELVNPEVLQERFNQLDDEAQEVRVAAVNDFVEAGSEGTAYCIARLEEATPRQKSGIQTILKSQMPLSFAPLTAALADDRPSFRVVVIQMLGHVAPNRATPFLLGPALSPQLSAGGQNGAQPVLPKNDPQRAATEVLFQRHGRIPTLLEAEQLLQRQIDGYFAGRFPTAPDAHGRVTVWLWQTNSEGKQNTKMPQPVSHKVSIRDSGILSAAPFATALAALVPQNERYASQALMCKLYASKLQTGLDKPLSSVILALAKTTQTARLEFTLHESMRRNFSPAAIGAAELLGARGDFNAVYGQSPNISPLVQAMRSSNRRLRFAALQAVMKINPPQPYAGASYTTETLAYFIQGGTHRVVVAMPSLQQARTVAGWLSTEGYEISAGSTGLEAIRSVMNSPDTEFVFLDEAISHPNVREAIYQIRSTPAGRELPIGLLAGENGFDRAARIAAGDAKTLSFARPNNAAAAKALATKVLQLAGPSIVSKAERQTEAKLALQWATVLLSKPRNFYDTRKLEPAIRESVFVPELSTAAVSALGHFGSADTQKQLVELASRRTEPVANRKSAAKAFTQSVKQFGLQLTREEKHRQYTRYNASELADRETQKVLGSILDAIEGTPK